MATPGCGASLVVIPDSSPSDSLTETLSGVNKTSILGINIDYMGTLTRAGQLAAAVQLDYD